MNGANYAIDEHGMGQIEDQIRMIAMFEIMSVKSTITCFKGLVNGWNWAFCTSEAWFMETNYPIDN